MEEEELSLALPQLPRDAYYEDYVAAILNAGGYYLQRSIHDFVDGIEMLELDVVATKLTMDNVSNIVIEIKSGEWGIRDVFKVHGWLNYLQINAKGAFIFQKDVPEHDYETMKKVAACMDIDLIPNQRKEDLSLDDKFLKEKFNINIDGIPKSVIKAFRYSFNLERVVLDYIRIYSKDHPEHTIAAKVYQYMRKLSTTSFIQKSPLEKLRFLTSLSKEHAYIAAILDNELAGKGVMEAEAKPNFISYFKTCFPKTSELTPVYVAMHAVIINKLHVLESIVEYISLPDKKNISQLEAVFKQIEFNALNPNIIDAIKVLKSREYFYLYPYFWQVFIYVFGGFILIDKQNDEYKLLSQITGIPVEEVESAIYFWDQLYPTEKGWFSKPINENSKIFYLKMIAPEIAGIGANFRLHLYAKEGLKTPKDYFDCLKGQLTGCYTYNDLLGWNNIAFEFLKADTKLHVIKAKSKSKFDKHIKEVNNYINACGRYEKTISIEDHLKKVGNESNSTKGFIGKYIDESYDLYIIKEINKCEKINMTNIARELKLNVGKLSNAFIIGTDALTKFEKDDSIWAFSQFVRTNISAIGDVIDICNKLR